MDQKTSLHWLQGHLLSRVLEQSRGKEGGAPQRRGAGQCPGAGRDSRAPGQGRRRHPVQGGLDQNASGSHAGVCCLGWNAHLIYTGNSDLRFLNFKGFVNLRVCVTLHMSPYNINAVTDLNF